VKPQALFSLRSDSPVLDEIVVGADVSAFGSFGQLAAEVLFSYSRRELHAYPQEEHAYPQEEKDPT
jgi:hypothetical protein